jgi:hypothetical protein
MTPNGYSLEAECRVFTMHLLGCLPDPYVIRKYVDAHKVSPAFSGGNRFDDLLVRVAAERPALTKLADSYARIFTPTGLLRKKLVLLLAILETSGPSYHLIDASAKGGQVVLMFQLLIKGILFGLNLIAGAIVFLPMQMIFASGQRRSG